MKKKALQNVNVKIRKGTVHAIVGENGAGKSTLMNILSGVLKPTEGTIAIDETDLVFREPMDAIRKGIGMVYQHFMLVPSLPVWKNVYLGIEPIGFFGKLNKRKAIDHLTNISEHFAIPIEPEKITGRLTIGEQQKIEILKVLIRNAEYIIFDEPTAVLTPQEIDQFLENVKMLKKEGKTIIFISHKLNEVLEIADDISILRTGEKIATLENKDLDATKLVEMMIGREVKLDGMPLKCEEGGTILDVDKLCTPRSRFLNGLSNISLKLHAGEVVGIAGVDGNGQTELVDAILGFCTISSGDIKKQGHSLAKLSSSKIRERGIALIPPDRRSQGLVLSSDIIKNMVLGLENSAEVSNGFVINLRKTEEKTLELTKKYDVRVPTLRSDSSSLSGGNQQKLILAREFGLRDSDLIIAVNPTRGLDVGAIEFVYEQIELQKQKGKAILLVSTELSEILRLSDRIAVFYKGENMGIIPREEATPLGIGELMMGIRKKQEVPGDGE